MNRLPFRRKYYNNGSHAGFILYVNDPASDPNDITALRTALKAVKGQVISETCSITVQMGKRMVFKSSQLLRLQQKMISPILNQLHATTF